MRRYFLRFGSLLLALCLTVDPTLANAIGIQNKTLNSIDVVPQRTLVSYLATEALQTRLASGGSAFRNSGSHWPEEQAGILRLPRLPGRQTVPAVLLMVVGTWPIPAALRKALRFVLGGSNDLKGMLERGLIFLIAAGVLYGAVGFFSGKKFRYATPEDLRSIHPASTILLALGAMAIVLCFVEFDRVVPPMAPSLQIGAGLLLGGWRMLLAAARHFRSRIPEDLSKDSMHSFIVSTGIVMMVFGTIMLLMAALGMDSKIPQFLALGGILLSLNRLRTIEYYLSMNKDERPDVRKRGKTMVRANLAGGLLSAVAAWVIMSSFAGHSPLMAALQTLDILGGLGIAVRLMRIQFDDRGERTHLAHRPNIGRTIRRMLMALVIAGPLLAWWFGYWNPRIFPWAMTRGAA